MTGRTPHGEERRTDADRPTGEAESDKRKATEIYRDVESGLYIFVGARGRTHIYTAKGLHHTSFRTTRGNRLRRVNAGKWEHVERAQLPIEVQ
jgi:hypothetical protein